MVEKCLLLFQITSESSGRAWLLSSWTLEIWLFILAFQWEVTANLFWKSSSRSEFQVHKNSSLSPEVFSKACKSWRRLITNDGQVSHWDVFEIFIQGVKSVSHVIWIFCRYLILYTMKNYLFIPSVFSSIKRLKFSRNSLPYVLTISIISVHKFLIYNFTLLFWIDTKIKTYQLVTFSLADSPKNCQNLFYYKLVKIIIF